MGAELSFLEELSPLPWEAGQGPAGSPDWDGLGIFRVFLSPHQPNNLEVLVADASPGSVKKSTLQKLWERRRGKRSPPVLVVALDGVSGGVRLCGHSASPPEVYDNESRPLGWEQAETLCREALDEPETEDAVRYLNQALPVLEAELPGLDNQGLFALQELKAGVPGWEDWEGAGDRSQKIRSSGAKGKELLEELGYKVVAFPAESGSSGVGQGDRIWLLRGSRSVPTPPGDATDDQVKEGEEEHAYEDRALAVLLERGESPDLASSRFNGISPVSYALNRADDRNLDWVLMVQGTYLRLYATDSKVGVGRRSRSETYIGCRTPMLRSQDTGYLWQLYSADALHREGSVRRIRQGSERFAGDLAKRLRERIYEHVVPTLAQGIATARNLPTPNKQELSLTYHMALTVLFRALFIAYAEDRDLLPYSTNPSYRERSLKRKAQAEAKLMNEGQPVEEGQYWHWKEFQELCEAISKGRKQWDVPIYNGTLFSSEAEGGYDFFSAGKELAGLQLPNEVFEEAMRYLLVIDTAEEVHGPVDFRSLGVREFGTIYEGLLESELALAETNLGLDSKGHYIPLANNAKPEQVVVQQGEVYLHNRSGARKASGSYYTPSFVVEHLLEKTLEPALEDHFARLDALDDEAAAERFFDFRVADIAMGSGHFLIAAIDMMEKRMGWYLDGRRLDGVFQQLGDLQGAAEKVLETDKGGKEIESGQVLRRMIARHCIYGVDRNELAVELARLAVWLHTFVPGLPLSLLDHHLVHGNSLVGIANMDEAAKFLSDDLLHIQGSGLQEKFLGEAAIALQRLANLNDASMQDLRQAQEAEQEVQDTLIPSRDFLSLLMARRISEDKELRRLPLELEDFQRLQQKFAETLHEGGGAGGDQVSDLYGPIAGALDLSGAMAAARLELDRAGVLHFPVAFPEVFLGERQGFDVLLGNPPWEKLKVDRHAFWGRHFPGLRGMNKHARDAKMDEWEQQRHDLVMLLEQERAEAATARAVLLQSDYPGLGTGDPDLYKAFAWRFWRLAAKEGGRVGVVLPGSTLSNAGAKEFRRELYASATRLDLGVLENSNSWVFQEVDGRSFFALVSGTKGKPQGASIRMATGPSRSLEEFREAEEVLLEPAEVLRWSAAEALPNFPKPAKTTLSAFRKMTQVPRLEEDIGNEWRVRLFSELHTTHDADHVHEGQGGDEERWPVYKGKSFNLWAPDFGGLAGWANPEEVCPELQRKREGAGSNSPHAEFSQSHREDSGTLPCRHPRIAYRCQARSTDQRTMLACLLPPKVFLLHSANSLLWPRGDEKDQAFLLGVLSSMPLDWYARRWVVANLTEGYVDLLRIPRPTREDSRWERIVQLAGRLACPDERFASWAAAVGVKHGAVGSADKDVMICELDALVGHLYGLNEKQLRHIYDTFHRGKGQDEIMVRKGKVLEYYKAIAS